MKRAPKQPKLSPAEIEHIKAMEDFSRACRGAGCPPEQAQNFLMAGVILQPKQLKQAAAAREADKPDGPDKIMAAGGRGSSKTHGWMAQIFCDDCQRVPGLKVLCLRKIGSAAKEQIEDFVTKICGRFISAGQCEYRKGDRQVKFSNGSFVIIGNFKDEKDIDKYLGLEYDLIYLMESNQLTATKKTNVLGSLRSSKQGWRPRVYEDTNPGGQNHGGNKKLYIDGRWRWDGDTYIQIAEETNTRYIHSTVDDNKFVNPEYKKFLDSLVGSQRKAWRDGNWEFMAGAFFSNFFRDTHVYPNSQTDINLRAVHCWFAGFDYGFSHWTVFTLACEDEGGNVFIVGSHRGRNMIIDEHVSGIRDLLSRWNLDVGDLEFIAAGKDCFQVDKDGSTVATEYQKHGVIFTAVHIIRINAWSQMAEMFGSVEHQIRPRCFIHKDCEELISQIETAQCDEKKPNDIEKRNCNPEDGEGGDDDLDSGRNVLVMNYSSMVTSAKPLQMGSFKGLTQGENKDDVIDVELVIQESEESDLRERGIIP